MSQAPLVDDVTQVIENVREYQRVVKEGTSQIIEVSLVQHWYYFPLLDMVGPSRFIGHKNATGEKYDRIGGGYGGRTQGALRGLDCFERLTKSSSDGGMYERARTAAERLCSVLGKKPRKNTTYWVLKLSAEALAQPEFSPAVLGIEGKCCVMKHG